MSWDYNWEKVFSSRSWGKYPSESVIRFVARNFYQSKLRAEVRILEIGCGTGANLWFLAKEGFSAYGIEGSPTAVAQATTFLEKENLKAAITQGDIINLPYENEYFDAVLDVECLCCNNFVNTKKILKEVSRVLKPDGLLYSRTFTNKTTIDSNAEELGPFEFNNAFAGCGYVRFSDEDQINKIYNTSFTIQSIDLAEHTLGSMQNIVSEYVLHAKKKD